MASASLEYIRRYYGVPARRGGRVEYTGGVWPRSGTITGADGTRLRIRLDGEKHAFPYHPTWKLRYFSEPSDA